MPAQVRLLNGSKGTLRSSPRDSRSDEEPKAQPGGPLWGTQGCAMARKTPNLLGAMPTVPHWEWKMQQKAIYFFKPSKC